MKDLIIGTAGHIDHGKTTLLKALTGIDADRLEEEKRRGITIDIGFAHMELGPYRLGFIDVPGHEKFVKNMLAGIGGIHLVLLVVAADESVMPQTVEHFQICKLLEIPRGIVVLTKKNLVETDLLPLVEEEVRDLVRGSFLEEAPIVAVDSLSGEGLEGLKKVMLGEIAQIELAASPQVFRLPVDRVFTIRGFGTVVTGTLSAGEVAKDDAVAVYPSHKEGKVRGLEIFSQKTDVATSGQRTALNLTGLEKEDLERGMILSRPGVFQPSHMMDAVVHILPSAPQPLKHRSPIRFHHGSGEFLGRVYLLEGHQIEPGASGLVQLRLDTPTVCCPRDHFILRRYSPLTTIGGGVILDNAPTKHSRRDLPEVLPALKQLWNHSPRGGRTADAALVEYLVRRKGAEGLDLDELVARTGLLPGYLLETLKLLDSVVLIPAEPALAVLKTGVDQIKQNILQFVTRFHANNPLAPGVSREELKKRFLGSASGTYFQFVLDELVSGKKIQVDSSTVALYGKRVDLAPEQQKIRDRIFELIEMNGLQPPTQDELLQQLPYPAERVREVYYFLLQKGELVRIGSDIVLPARQVGFLKDRVKQVFPSGQAFTVPQFKDLFNLSRKYAIPYLEFLDRERVTRRLGDKRIVL